VKNVSSSYLITLDASLSYNPNEPSHKQDQDIYYIWRCDVETDDVNCKEHTSTSKKNNIITMHLPILVYIKFVTYIFRSHTPTSRAFGQSKKVRVQVDYTSKRRIRQTRRETKRWNCRNNIVTKSDFLRYQY